MMLDVTDLQFRYPHGPKVVDGFTGRFDAGDMTAIVGPSGRGKSTLLFLLGLLLRPTAGTILVNGRDVRRDSDRDRSRMRAEQFGFVFQDAALDATRTVIDNVCESALYRGQSVGSVRARGSELLDKFGVGIRANAKPTQVSGGQAQRIALARAMLHEPQFLLCDEPTGNLDDESTAVVLRALAGQARRGAAVIIVTHSAAVVDACDTAVRL
jgi:ABC-type lipoprotein export system ATPase subunit